MPDSVLVVDDDLRLARALLIRLRGAGFEAHHASCGRDALATALQIRPRVVVLDIMLPDWSGIQVCKVFRAEAALRDTPVVFLSANSSSDDQRRATDAGGNAFFAKPCPFPELLAVLRTLCPPAPLMSPSSVSADGADGRTVHIEECKP